MFYLKCDDVQLVGASPECLCKVDNRKVYNHAIAGTVKRGKTPAGENDCVIRLARSEGETHPSLLP
jgi:anthranilate synthase component 1